ncbi:alpha/beta hydrolase domain-containing protein [Dietzia kunjamensis]|uniref:alpha/beta hydrolase domain-containing protein n=1 Tax=Dietzia kunjamensis TaxID=322509 RepID=UPI0020975349|nr:alpha/beta hydrolase domain-containing protein [Dietzia kunjamensis]USX45729.1 alpha/beta hydrolase domain-containing protein [Dietzia kunjamensis]
MQPVQTPTFTELTEGRIAPPMAARPGPDLAAAGFTESEWAVAGEAVSYSVGELPTDGRIQLARADSASFATRVLVRRPDAARFSGVVLVEWLNVSGGQDAAPEYTYLADEIVRAGHAWVGVSAQFIGVEGGDAAVGMGGQTVGLREQRRERYGDLHHPGDAYSYDIVTQVGRFCRDARDDGPLAGLAPDTVIAIGESQSAIALTSYIDGVHPLVGVFDGFLLHSRGGGALPFDDRGCAAGIATAVRSSTMFLRDDLDTPVLVVQAEGDLGGLLDSARSRQPDSENVVTWEIAGQAHADAYQLGELAGLVDCGGAINSGQQVFVVRAALRHLVSWVAGGARPPGAPPVELDDDEVVPGDLGIGRGGVRTPAVEAPVERLVGAPYPQSAPFCMLLGRTEEVAEEQLRQRWSGRDEYLRAYEEATDRLIAEGFLLADDRAEILADARPERISW